MFKIKDLGELTKILGMKLTRDRKNSTLKLDQEHYIQENLAKFRITKEIAYPTLSPLDNYKSLRKSDPDKERYNKTKYQSQNGT